MEIFRTICAYRLMGLINGLFFPKLREKISSRTIQCHLNALLVFFNLL